MARHPNTEAKWASRVAAWRESGQSAREFVVGRGYAPTTLKWWSHQLGATAKTAAASAPSASEGTMVPKIDLVRVIHSPKRGGVERLAGTTVVELETIRVRVEPGVDEATLRAVLAALRGAR